MDAQIHDLASIALINDMKSEYPLISVIVPVYKVEPWLVSSIGSIQNQTYRNLEIILVDDGSPDRCGDICERLALQDKRIRVLHKGNGGLSSARNAGLNICNGEYIGFVDSDDFIHQEMYERLYDDIIKFGTRLAFCQTTACKFDDLPNSFLWSPTTAQGKCVSSKELVYESLKDTKWFSASTKLYHKSLFAELRFPDGRINEDYPITLRIYNLCGDIVVDFNKMYAYRKRDGSITTSPVSEHTFDQVVSAEEAYLFIRKTHSDCSGLAARILLTSCLGVLLKTDGVLSKQFEAKRDGVFEVIRKYYPTEKHNLNLHRQQTILLAAANAGKSVYSMASKTYRAFKSMDSR